MQKPILLISACLDEQKVRYDGSDVPSRIVKDLKEYVNIIKVCPEFEIGLGVPREPIRIVKKENQYRLIQHNTNKDVTDDMINFCDKFVNSVDIIDGAILKSKSPTMGLQNIKVYSGMKGSPVVERCGGFFADRIATKFENFPLEEENRLKNKKIRDHFLNQLFLFARYRHAKNSKTIEEFHNNNILLFDFYNPEISKTLNYTSSDYFEKVKLIMNSHPNSEAIYNFFNNLIGDSEILQKYKNNKIGFTALKEVSKFLIKDSSLLSQSFYNPYPHNLQLDAEDDRTRDYWKDES